MKSKAEIAAILIDEACKIRALLYNEAYPDPLILKGLKLCDQLEEFAKEYHNL